MTAKLGLGLAALVAVLAVVATLTGNSIEEPPERDHALDSTTETPAPPPEHPEDTPAPAAPAAPEESASLTVRIVAAGTGDPVAGARWFVRRDGEMLARGETDGLGVGEVDGLPPGLATVRAKARDFVRSLNRRVDLPPGGEVDLKIALRRGRAIRGLVLDVRDGRPIAEARVLLTPGGRRDGYFEMTFEPPLGEAVTGPGGWYEIEGVPTDRLVTLTANADGYAERHRSLQIDADSKILEGFDLELEPSGAVRGIVRDPEGKPAPGATVYAIPAAAPEMLFQNPDLTVSGSGGTFVSLTARCDAGGRYEIRGLTTGGLYVLRAALAGYSDSADQEDVRTTIDSLLATVDLSLRAPGVVLVRLVGPDGEPVTDAKGFVMPGGDPFNPTAPDEEGVYRIEGLPPGTYQLHLEPARYPVEEFEFEVRPGETVSHDLELQPGSFLAGVLLNDLDRPVAGASIDVSRSFGRKFRGLSPSKGKATTDAEGRFRVENLRTGPHTMRSYSKGLEAVSLGPLEAPVEGIVMRALRVASVKARLLLPRGIAAPEKVRLTQAGRPFDPDVWGFGGMGWSGRFAPWNGGDLEYTGLASFPQELWLSVPGLAPVRIELDPRPGETVDLGVIRLTEGVAIEGGVVGPDGTAAPGATVWLEREPLGAEPVEADSGGRFRLAHLPEGKANVVAEADGFLAGRVPVEVKAGLPSQEIRLHRGGAVLGRVLDEEGNPQTGLDLHFFDPEDKDAENRFDHVSTDGRGEFGTRLLAGRYEVEVWRVRDLLITVEVTLTEGGETPLEIVLEE